MSKRNRQFFEVFHGVMGPGSAPTQSTDPVTRSAPAASAPAAASGARYVTFRVTPETLIVLGILFAGLLFVCHVWGYQRGARKPFDKPTVVAKAVEKALPEPAVAPAPPKRSPALNVADSGRANGPDVFYALCVWTGNSRPKAEELARELKTSKLETHIVQLSSTRGYSVGVGRFDSIRTPEAQKLKEEFQNMVYRGQKEFKSCYWISVSDKAKSQ